jgi:hypothetical protein
MFAAYAAGLAFDVYAMFKQDSESIRGEKLAWNFFTSATLPAHRQAEVAARSGGKVFYPTIDHVTHETATVTGFDMAGYYERATHMNVTYGGRYGPNQ